MQKLAPWEYWEATEPARRVALACEVVAEQVGCDPAALLDPARLYGSDGADSEPMKGCALLIETDDPVAAAALFAALSAGGRVTVPFAKQFWGDHYGNFTDQFGVQWAMNCSPKG